MVEGGIDASYFLDKMQFYEIMPALSGIEKAKRPLWEMTRMISVTTMRAMGGKVDSSKLKFPWETENNIKEDMPDVAEMKQLKMRMKNLNNKAK